MSRYRKQTARQGSGGRKEKSDIENAVEMNGRNAQAVDGCTCNGGLQKMSSLLCPERGDEQA